ncbi:inward rectifier potassium channel 16 [Monodelphis domestica]|uniref:Inward rectifier potassium channel 16 n=1 Tax=Monodelphis domestica TaxID=13616 RepID=F7F889_MONDO|nr:inward rectifier potassium channel 16 [Monodelphis domestica]XP_007482781.1 inward rectifier potassium channel 16 [Monodelphis domestica]XP_007482782.1 inward rectifier potassium channel 16 [Monodelphis domestica]XP_056673197.1 inward rectifier potassium channel 16 [Monodelphis domestica]XP_056673198.1 inward rectifier potassium channel 16 [Monodelphis domestica]XP_056673199.1 inward rectifier potassium channel 16 [Monodelphis domestica]XP_056673200.1 inward rectifier potassium channel 16 
MSYYGSNYRIVNMEGNVPKYTNYHPEHIITEKRRARRRLLHKDGSCNVYFKHIFGEWGSYMVDIFTTLVDTKWRHMFVIFSLSYILSWLIFGLIFWVIALHHGDLINDPNITPCVDNVHTFTGAFLFSLETQTTIGYGSRCVTEECSVAVLVVILQSILSCIINTFIIGAALAKMATARKRAQTIRFSYFALIGMRDGKLCLMWRIGDFRPNHVVEGTVRAQLLRYVEDSERRMTMGFKDLKLVNDQIILVTPVTIVHEIDHESPLYALDRKAVAKDNFEILVTFTYTGDSTGTSHQSRSSYVPREILWGHRFNDVLEVKKKYYKVNCLQFEGSVEVYAPFCSAKQLDWKDQQLHNLEKTTSGKGSGMTETKVRRRSFSAIAIVSSSENPDEMTKTTADESNETTYQKALLQLNRISVESQM